MANDRPREEELGVGAASGTEDQVVIPIQSEEMEIKVEIPEITGDEFPMAHLPDEASEVPDQIPDLDVLPDVPEPILQEIHKAPRHAYIRIKSLKDYEAVELYLRHYNPKHLKVEHRPGLSVPAIWIGR